MKNKFLAVVLITLGMTAAIFQNCSKQDFAADYKLKNGWAYDGLVFTSTSLCADGEPRGKLILRTSASSLLVKENCNILNPPKLIGAPDLVVNTNDLSQVTYLGQVFVAQAPQNKISFGQSVSGVNATAATSIQSPAFPTTNSGDLMVCSVLYNSPDTVSQISSMSDSAGNVFRRAVAPTGARTAGNSGYTAEVWYAENLTAGTNVSVQANFSVTMPSTQMINCYEYSGIAAANSFDQTAISVTDTTTPKTVSIPPIDTNWDNELVFVAYWGAPIATLPQGMGLRGGNTDAAGDFFRTTLQGSPLTFDLTGSTMFMVVTFRSK